MYIRVVFSKGVFEFLCSQKLKCFQSDKKKKIPRENNAGKIPFFVIIFY